MPLAYVPQYHYDVFISYAHGDNSAPLQWVTRFADVIGREIGQQLGRDPALWVDAEELRTGSQLNDKVKYDLSRTAVLVRLISPYYNNSGYCSLERAWFESAAGALDPLVIDRQSRSLQYILRPDPNNPPRATTLYTALHNEAGAPIDPGRWEEFQTARETVASDVCHLLRAMQSRRASVYAPYGGPDVEPVRQRLIADLHGEGYRTVPPPNAEFDRVRALDEIDRSPISVFHLGASYLPELEQRLQVAAGRKPVIVWISPDCEMEPAQTEFADRLRENPPGTLLADNSVEELIQLVRLRLKEGVRPTLSARVQAAGAATDAVRLVYLLCKPSDRDAAGPLRTHVENAGLQVLMADIQAADVGAQRVEEMTRFSQASGVLIFAKSFAPTWFEQQLRKIAQATGGTRIADAVALLDPPPKAEMLNSARKKGFLETRPERLLVVADEQGMARQLDPFLRLLGGRSAA